MTTVIKHVSLFDGVQEKLQKNSWLSFDEKTGRIIQIGNGEPDQQKDVKIIDAQGKYLLPGLINTHTHIMMDPIHNKLDHLSETECTVNGINNLKQLLSAGVTYIRDCGCAFDTDIKLMQLMSERKVSGPQIVPSGRPMTMTGGHGDFIEGVDGDTVWGHLTDSVDEMRHAVRVQFKHGSKNIKVMATGGVMSATDEIDDIELNGSELAMAVHEAHSKHMTVASHAQGNLGIQLSLDAGVDSIEHGIYIDEQQAEFMREKNIFLVPTLNASQCIADDGKGILPDYMIRKNDKVKQDFFKNVAMALKKGVKVAVGTDAGTPFNRFDIGTAREIELLVSIGASTAQALFGATRYAAELLKIDDAYGTLEEGKFADMLLLDENPLTDIAVLQKGHKEVFQKGHRVN